jgi:general secretion pathway protein D
MSSPGSSLNVRSTGKISVDINDTARHTFERIAELGGLHVAFDDRLMDSPAQPFAVNDVGVLDALDFLSLQTRTFWRVLDATTIFVAPDNQSVRRSVEPKTVKVIQLTQTPTESAAGEIVRLLRTLLNIRDIGATDKEIVINDNPETVFLAEKIVAGVDR